MKNKILYESVALHRQTIINIDGQDIRLKVVKETEGHNKSKRIYRSGNMTVMMELVEVKEEKDSSTFKEQGGSVPYKAVMTVNRGLSKSVAKLVGTYGC